MNRILVALGAATFLCALTLSTSPVVAQSKPPLRVCGDPDNLPFSNEKLEGFENKIATLVAGELGTTVNYFWWQHQRGLVRNTFDEDKCDVVIGIPKGYDLVQWTKPYYRTSYVIAYRNDRNYHITSLDAPELKRLRIGVYSNTTPQEALARRDIIENVATDYSLFFDLEGDPAERPAKLLTDLVAGTIDVATPWGPVAGYFAKKLHAPLELVTLEGDVEVPLAFDISMGVKKGNQALKTELDGVIDRRQGDIRAILEDYGVPMMPAHQVAAAGGAQTPPAAGGAQAQVPAADTAQAAPSSSGPRKNPFSATDAAVVAEGRMFFLSNGCSGCHGAGGGGGMGPSLIDEDWKYGSTDDVLYKLIKGQIPDQTMPTVYSTLDDQEVWKMLTYVRSLYAGDKSKIDW